MNGSSACSYACASQVPTVVRRGFWIPWTWSYGWLQVALWVWEVELRSSSRTSALKQEAIFFQIKSHKFQTDLDIYNSILLIYFGFLHHGTWVAVRGKISRSKFSPLTRSVPGMECISLGSRRLYPLNRFASLIPIFLKNHLVVQASFELLCSSQWPWSSFLTSQWQNYVQNHQAWIMLWWDSTLVLLHAKQALYHPSYIPGK